jgi:hypothetical protein
MAGGQKPPCLIRSLCVLLEHMQNQVSAAPLSRWEAAIRDDALSERWNPAPLPLCEPFGAWLLAQHDRGDWIDQLAAAARADRGFPKRGSPDDIRKRLQSMGADGDTFEQLDDAERCWAGL